MQKIHKNRLVCALMALSLLLMLQSATAQVIFKADFESGSGTNDVSKWVPENAGMKWEVADFPGSGKGLKQTVEGCANSGNTPLPGVTNFTDGIIQFDMSWGDDDSWGAVLRQTAPDKGYVITFGYIETPAVIIALLDKGCGKVGMCNDQTLCENNPANTLNQTPHTLAADPATLTRDNSVAYLGRIEAKGDTIRVWYKARADVPNPLAPDLGKPLVEIKDGTHKSGSVGIWHESQGGSEIDNVWVFGPSGIVAVEPQGKLATSWGSMSSLRASDFLCGF